MSKTVFYLVSLVLQLSYLMVYWFESGDFNTVCRNRSRTWTGLVCYLSYWPFLFNRIIFLHYLVLGHLQPKKLPAMIKKKVLTIFWQNLKILGIVLSRCCKILSHYGSKGWLCLFKNTFKMSLFRQKNRWRSDRMTNKVLVVSM